MPPNIQHKVGDKLYISYDKGANWEEIKPLEHTVDGKKYTSWDGNNWTPYLSPAEKTVKSVGDLGVKAVKWILTGKKENPENKKENKTKTKTKKTPVKKFEMPNMDRFNHSFEDDDRWSKGPFGGK